MALRKGSIDLEIQTLLNVGHHHYSNDTIHSVITPQNFDGHFNSKNISGGIVKNAVYGRQEVNDWWSRRVQRSSDSESSDASQDDDQFYSVEVNGREIDDLPVCYQVNGLKYGEFPVIGVYVDRRVIAGYQYRVRLLGTNRYLFKGQALTLKSVGIGYGKRITMEGNGNYFYSDTHPEGYGFELVGIAPGDKFTICDEEERPIGDATISSVLGMDEINTAISAKSKEVKKQLRISFACSVVYWSDGHGLLPLCRNASLQLNGLLSLSKSRRSKKAYVTELRDVELPPYGLCSFESTL